MGQFTWRLSCLIALSLVILNAGLHLTARRLPAERTLLYLTKPSRVDTAELALLDIATGLTHPITNGADILSYTTTPTPYSVLYIGRVPGGHAFYALDVRTRESRFLMIDPTQAITPTISPDGTRMVYDNFSTRALYLTDMSTLRSEQVLAMTACH
jgi:Tol biopolymer transport system component